jgi:1-acyl-sn-glycerol-3-phosphate acyltransferase
MRTLWILGTVAVGTIVFGSIVILAELLGVPQRPGGIYEKAASWWARALIAAAGVKVTLHDGDRLRTGGARVVVANHVSWFDIPVLIACIPDFTFVAKRELSRIWWFGRAARKVGVVYIDRENRKAAFEAYEEAAESVRRGRPVIVFPEGTRGSEYALRPFKKGPFVLAVSAHAEVIPVVIHGTLPLGRGQAWTVAPGETPGRIDVHVLPAVPAGGLEYGDRTALAEAVHARMQDFLHSHYGIAPRVARDAGVVDDPSPEPVGALPIAASPTHPTLET